MRTAMKRWLPILALGLICPSARADSVQEKLGLTYSLLLKRGDATVATPVADGFETGDRFRLRLEPKKDCYAYLVVERGRGDFRLLYPDGRSRRGKNLLAKKKEFIWPQEGWLRLDERTGMERMYLILSAERIYELEARFALADKAFPESVLVDIRDRYSTDESTYRRVIDDERVRVRFRSQGLPAVLIEEITLRHM